MKTNLYRMYESLLENKNNNTESCHSNLGLFMEEGFKDLFQVNLHNCTGHTEKQTDFNSRYSSAI